MANPNTKKPTSGKEKLRRCLKCRTEFLSDSPANRLCDQCRGSYGGIEIPIRH